jgi:hypothetical protein
MTWTIERERKFEAAGGVEIPDGSGITSSVSPPS